MRQLMAIGLVLGGLFLGVMIARELQRYELTELKEKLSASEEEVDRFRNQQNTERDRALTDLAKANKAVEAAREEVALLERRVANLQTTVAQQQSLIEQLRGSSEPAKTTDDDDLTSPSRNEDGIVRGGRFAYHHVKMQLQDRELEVAGEIENVSSKSYPDVFLHLQLFDKRGKPVETRAINFSNFKAGETRGFRELVLADKLDKINSIEKFRIKEALVVK